jgi:hypothetical protein
MKFLAEDDTLTITLDAVESFFALKHRLVIKRQDIVNLTWQPELTVNGRLWRFGGTDIPGALYAGHFKGGGQRYFLYIRNPRGGLTWTTNPLLFQNCLSITLKDRFHQQVLLTCDPDIGASLLNWYKGV